MTSDPQTGNIAAPKDEAASRRMLIQFALMAGVLWLVLIGANGLAWHLSLKPENQAIVQFQGGWDRIIKPVAADSLQPEIAIFGASWARDMFDPGTVGALSGKRVFNHAVTGGTPWEARRFAESLLAADPALELAILNADSFSQELDAPKFNPPFNAAILNTLDDGAPNPDVRAARLTGLLLSGSSLGYAAGIGAKLFRRDVLGESEQALIASYSRADYAPRQDELAAAKDHFLGTGGPLAKPGGKVRQKNSPSADFVRTVQAFCARNVDVSAYFTPHHVTRVRCDETGEAARRTRALMLDLKGTCASRLAFYDFGYPNAVTLEGVASNVNASWFYRPDGHPRPVLGDLLFSLMSGNAASAPALGLDERAATDLLGMKEAEFEAWNSEMSARCTARWTPEARALLMSGKLPNG